VHNATSWWARWTDHIASTLTRPILIIDEAQEMLTTVFNELRLLSSKEFDSRSLLCVVFAGDARLPERFRHQDLLPFGSRIRRRLNLDYATRDELLACLDHLLEAGGNPTLLTTELKTVLAEHAAGNYRVMMNLGDELLAHGFERSLAQLDEKLYFEVFSPPAKPKPTAKKR
jgi:type II secretory pathway predicted ATPase ExeA